MATVHSALLAGVALGGAGPAGCRCRAPDPCFAAVPFDALNASVGGRLIGVPDEFAPCHTAGPPSRPPPPQCAAALNSTDDEFFYTSQVGGFMHTGLASAPGLPGWSIAHPLSAYAVAVGGEFDNPSPTACLLYTSPSPRDS